MSQMFTSVRGGVVVYCQRLRVGTDRAAAAAASLKFDAWVDAWEWSGG